LEKEFLQINIENHYEKDSMDNIRAIAFKKLLTLAVVLCAEYEKYTNIAL
jgi:hypothetical protein